MKLDLEVCRTIAIRYGLPLQFVFKEFHLMDALSQVATYLSANSGTGPLVLKGGTALNKVYLQGTQRFSEDADFDLVSESATRELLGFSRNLAKGLEGYEINGLRKIRSTVQFYCAYETPLGGVDHVRIDIVPKRLLSVRQPQIKTISSEFVSASVTGILVYSIDDLTARKMNALAMRAEGKDMYDIHAALPLCSKEVLKKAIGLMLKSEGEDQSVTEFLQKTIARLEKTSSDKQRNLTNPFIPAALRPKNWEELKNDLLAKLGSLQE